MMKLGCYLFMAIVGLIGFMNLANTMIINITTKKQEYGVLQAVGMTNKQLNLSLQIQGLIFTVGTICVALAAGLPLGYALFSYAKHNGIFGMNVYHVPLIPILVMILLVGILQIVLSCVLSSNLKKETLVERIRIRDSKYCWDILSIITELKALGFKKFCTFDKMQPIFHQL